jgi:glycosyltransferase involved in cell wall biosynthesis
MMKVLQINSFFSVGGPPRIVKGIYDTLLEQGHDCVLAAGRETPIDGMKIIKIGTSINKYWHLFMSRVFDAQGFSSNHATKKLINKIEKYQPDIIHLHNLHGYYINIEILFNYLKESNIPVVWTLHDCWAFTGHCAHFDYIGCDKWRTGCFNCPQKKEYPVSNVFDNSKNNYQRKKQAFSGLNNMTIVTPSKWLAKKVEESFLNQYPVKVIHNGIDLNEFKPTESDFRKKYNLEDKKIVLGVAQNWGTKKGFYDFYKLSDTLDSNYKIILVGLDSRQKEAIPNKIIGFGRTNSIQELSEIYTAADVFVNPTLEDTFPTVNLESLACGTPVITYNIGGSPESIDKTCGIKVDQGDINGLAIAIHNLCNNKILSEEACLTRAKEFDKKDRYKEYVNLYEKLI